MSIPLPNAAVLDKHGALIAQAVQDNFDVVADAVANFGGKSIEIRFGTGFVTFTASATSATKLVNHGLGRLPVVVLATEVGTANGILYPTTAYTATQFQIVGGAAFGALTGNTNFGWIAIG